MTIRTRRLMATAALAGFIPLQVYATLFKGHGGFVGQHGLFGAFPKFFELSTGDPVLLAGLVDFTVVSVILACWMMAELPPQTRWRTASTWIWLISYCIFPGLGALLYLLWLRPEHRLMIGPPAPNSPTPFPQPPPDGSPAAIVSTPGP